MNVVVKAAKINRLCALMFFCLIMISAATKKMNVKLLQTAFQKRQKSQIQMSEFVAFRHKKQEGNDAVYDNRQSNNNSCVVFIFFCMGHIGQSLLFVQAIKIVFKFRRNVNVFGFSSEFSHRIYKNSPPLERGREHRRVP